MKVTAERKSSPALSRDPLEWGADRTHLAELAARFAAAFLRWVESASADGLAFHHVCLLETLRRNGPAVMCQLGTQVGLSPRAMTTAVDALAAQGLVERRRHPCDRRATLVGLTDAGLRAALSAVEPRMAAIATLFDDLSREQRAVLAETLAALDAGLSRRAGAESDSAPGPRRD